MRIEFNAAATLMSTNIRGALLAGLSVLALASCGGGDDGVSCLYSAPRITSSPSTAATTGYEYTYRVAAAYSCLISGRPAACHDVVGVQLPEGASAAGNSVSWNPPASQVNTDVNFSIATQPDVCGNITTQSWTVHVQAAPPAQVTSTSPFANATNVSILAEIAVTFDQSVDPRSVNTSSFHVAGPAGAVSGNLTVNGATVTFTPHVRLSYESTYTASVTTAVRTVAGAPLTSNYIWGFVTGQPIVESVTKDATNITATSATLNGRALTPLDVTTFVWFEYGTTIAYGSTTERRSITAAGDTQVPADVAGLQERTSNHFRLVAENSGGRFFGE